MALVQSLLGNAEYHWLWREGKREVAIAGVVEQGVVHGQVDVLAWRGDELWVVDYKTSNAPPTEAKNVPAAYQRQMSLYKTVLAQAYPTARVRTFLLWTGSGMLMELTSFPPSRG
jgi:ATP-dependent helicase/nuclease subunit A